MNKTGRSYSASVHTVGRQVGNASYSIALDLNVGAEHLADERLETTEFDD
jgi:hypothetical protein